VARRSTIRASDADRDGIVERLREAAAEGRLASHELEHRVTTALKAQTYGELDATVSDLPGSEPHRRRSRSGSAVATVRAHPGLILVAIPVAAVIVALMVVIAVMSMAVAVVALMLGHHRWVMSRGPWLHSRRRYRQLQSPWM
jgi:Flp pilus assembly protein TadB